MTHSMELGMGKISTGFTQPQFHQSSKISKLWNESAQSTGLLMPVPSVIKISKPDTAMADRLCMP